MSEKMLRIQLSEIATVRITCKQCKRGVIEVPIERLGQALEQGGCRFCRSDVIAPTSNDPLNALRMAIEELRRLESKLGIEFEIPAS
jgi:hypothetical protein